MHIIHSPAYEIDIGAHVFPTSKYRLVRERLSRAGLPGLTFLDPEPASWDHLALVHTSDYLRKLQTGDFDIAELAELELPWSPGLVEGFRLMTGGTIQAARLVAGAGSPSRGAGAAPAPARVVCHLGGGLHHAFADHGEGFCVFNDVAVAVRVLFVEGLASSAAVIDLDVHHGNGTAVIFHDDPHVFTFSMHQLYNYPVHKPRGSLDIGLPDGTPDGPYLDRLSGALKQVFEHFPDVAFYLAGADPYEDDQLGGLGLTKSGLRLRDRHVLQACRNHGVPVVVLLAGGYARRPEDTIDIHAATVEEAARL